ncbi:MAG: hypothetical protein ABEH43_01820, partial [Flavobacteriales bacterium]
ASGETRKILGQVKSGITFTKKSSILKKTLSAAWKDFNNKGFFNKGFDSIAILTDHLKAADSKAIPWILELARKSKDSQDFISHVHLGGYAPGNSKDKYEALKSQVDEAEGREISSEEVYYFLKHIYVLGYDLGDTAGVTLSLLQSHISQFDKIEWPDWAWSRIVDVAQSYNKYGGTLTLGDIDEDLKRAFGIGIKLPYGFAKPDIETQIKEFHLLSVANLVGGWTENEADLQFVEKLISEKYDDFQQKLKTLAQKGTEYLRYYSSKWKALNRIDLFKESKSHYYDRDLNHFRLVAIDLLKRNDPQFDLPPDLRYASNLYGKELDQSREIREGVAGTLALIGSFSDQLENCSGKKGKETAQFAVKEILSSDDWKFWGSIQDVLPLLAQAAPTEFMN